MANPVKDPLTGAETTGHVWDETLQEFNNPLPTWWIWTFYGTIIFALIYWIVYPSWPIADSYTKGIGSIDYKNAQGQETTRHWNMRSLLAKDMQESESALKQKEYLTKVSAASYEQIAQDPDMSAFVRSYGKGVFGDNCAACHQTGANGVVGLFPNLVDDDWLWGGKAEQVEQTILHGRLGYMPPYKETLSDAQADDTAQYVMSLSGLEHNADAAKRGEVIFKGETGGCYYCHTTEGKGLTSQGSANLTDKVWTIANIPAATDAAAQTKAIKNVILNGVQRQMPAFGQRLDATEIKVLVAYLGQMSASK
ncbi:MAG: cytochrome-c oxidase, cbb3-type subunit III [Thiofilum sp.]|uniref:cytochrome-c oxidase, cbb3-type subunit III n=1 Tax=Thiofilum sp. TaxID=2212733 RepID=UPI0025CF47F4|nr:cytochrome-c oxidase, cbb3-type subunit III [Thiofilum sp.]MBK8453458.1 cytochrome-c oxidase, cbb3-type subunit III [Thiofilum sp.]